MMIPGGKGLIPRSHLCGSSAVSAQCGSNIVIMVTRE